MRVHSFIEYNKYPLRMTVNNASQIKSLSIHVRILPLILMKLKKNRAIFFSKDPSSVY